MYPSVTTLCQFSMRFIRKVLRRSRAVSRGLDSAPDGPQSRFAKVPIPPA